MNEIINNVKKIAILRANALGDFLVILPAIKALRYIYKDAEIVLLGSPWHAKFLKKKRTDIDRVVVIPIYIGLREEAGKETKQHEIATFFRSMRAEKFDIAIHFQGRGMSANPFLKQLHARITVGHTCHEAAVITCSLPYVEYQHEIMRYIELVGLIGARTCTLEPQIKVFPFEIDQATTILQKRGVNAPYVVLHPGAKDIRRRWQPEKFAELGDEVAKKGYTILFTGDDKDEDFIQGIITNMRHPAFYACRQIPLEILAALLAKSTLVVSNDTGPLHLARAVGTRTVGIYWAPNFIKWGPLCTKKHRYVLSWRMQCPRCGIVPNKPFPFEPKSAGCEHPFSFVSDIQVDEVLKEVEGLLMQASVIN